jgi:hypothetical protein
MADLSPSCTCPDYRRIHREYDELERAQREGARNGPEVVKLTDEASAKGVILVPGGARTSDPKCPEHRLHVDHEWTSAELSALAHAFDVALRILPELPIEAKLRALEAMARAKREG